MLQTILVTILFLVALSPLVLAGADVLKKPQSKRWAVIANIASVFAICVLTVAMGLGGTAVAASAGGADVSPLSTISVGAGLGMIAAACSTGLACLGGGIAVSSAASAAIGAISENPKMFGKSLIFVALAEGIPIYGLLISVQIISLL